ncbi:MAG: Ku protein [Acidimicrobiales bacterium]|nr:Ku protein [Acidimicrobiales bacterium]
MLCGMPRATWSGSISFGLVNIPIKLYTAVSRKNVRFHQIDSRTGARVRQKRVSEADGEEVPYEAMAKGYELASGQYVLVSEDELASLDPEASRTIDIEEFVELSDIDPVYYDASYYVAPDKATVKPYALLVQAMEDAGKVGIARFVMRSKQYLAALRAVDGKLVLSTMVYADEVNDADEIPELEPVASVEVSDREVQMAEQLIASLAADFDPSRHHDTHREKVIELIERKAAGEEGLVATPVPVAEDKVVDLMAALEASVAAAKQARKRHPTALDADAGDSPATEEAEAEVPKKRTRSRKTA